MRRRASHLNRPRGASSLQLQTNRKKEPKMKKKKSPKKGKAGKKGGANATGKIEREAAALLDRERKAANDAAEDIKKE